MSLFLFFSGSEFSVFLNHLPFGEENNMLPKRESGGGVMTQNCDSIFRASLKPLILETEKVLREARNPWIQRVWVCIFITTYNRYFLEFSVHELVLLSHLTDPPQRLISLLSISSLAVFVLKYSICIKISIKIRCLMRIRSLMPTNKPLLFVVLKTHQPTHSGHFNKCFFY